MGRVLDVIQSEELKVLRDEVESFVAETMQDYLDKCKKRCDNYALSPHNTKNFYDSVWGTIEINEGEILILDSPILQRLRQIRHLGLANLLYSSADYSRFSHTLGVIQTADVMSRQIEKELSKKNVAADPAVMQIIRLSAIFHDCGHMFCSHASEMYFQKNRKAKQYSEVYNIRLKFIRTLEIKPSLSEIISALIVNSDGVRSLLSIVQQGLDHFCFNTYHADKIVEKICCLIFGFPYSEKMIPYAKVISGQVDSDKLDYLRRDSHATGVPTAVDMSRIFQKLRVVASDKHREMLSTTEERVDTVYKLAIAPAAINTVDQLVISRYMMFENIYYHQKTLTAEEMLRYAMFKLDQSTDNLLDRMSNVLKLTDNVVIHSNFAQTIKSVIPDLIIHDENEFSDACMILADLSRRRLFKRCVAFTDRNLTIVREGEKNFYNKVIAEKVIDAQNEFVTAVVKETQYIKEVLKDIDYFNERTDIILLSAPDISSTPLYSNLAIDGNKNKDRDMFFEADKWLESRASKKPQNYLVSYTEDRYLVYIAAEAVLFRDYGVLINDNMIFNENDETHISLLKGQLEKKGYFDSYYVLAPDNDIDVFESQMLKLLEAWKPYELYDTSAEKGISLNLPYFRLHIKQFRQFIKAGDFSVFVRCYLKMLEDIQIVSKSDITKALANNFKKIKRDENCSAEAIEVCNIGTIQDSSAQIAYHVNIVNQVLKDKFITKDLLKVLESVSENQIIVFLEDAFCSGRQILSIFETYMGIPIEERQTKETHVEELSEEKKERLKKCKLYFSFIFYEKKNEKFFRNRMKEIGLSNVHIVADREFPVPYFKNRNEDTEPGIDTLYRYLDAAGEKILSYKAYSDGRLREGWDEERVRTSRLGYNDAQQLIAFTWNTPTYTITPLWLRINAEEWKWIPLFPRIDK